MNKGKEENKLGFYLYSDFFFSFFGIGRQPNENQNTPVTIPKNIKLKDEGKATYLWSNKGRFRIRKTS